MIIGRLLLLSILLGELSSSPAERLPPLPKAAEALIEGLDLARVEGLGPDVDLALIVSSDAASQEGIELRRVVAGLVSTKLGQLGVEAKWSLEGSAPAPRLLARDRGAEWLLSIRVELATGGPINLRAELAQVDPDGLWGEPPESRPEAIVAFASSLARRPESLSDPTPQGRPGPMLDPPLRLGALPTRVLSMSSCDLDGDNEEELVVLGVQKLLVLRGPSYGRVLGEVDLGSLPRQEIRSRQPIGSVLCDSKLRFGHSVLASGHTVSFSPAGPVFAGALPGPPIAALPQGLLSAEPVPGANRYSGLALDGRPLPLPSGATFLELRAVGTQIFALGPDYRLQRLRLGEESKPELTEITSGVGLGGFEGDGETFLVTTSSRSASRDEVRVLRASARSVIARAQLPGPVFASTVILDRGRASAIVVAVREPFAEATTLFRLRLRWSERKEP